MKGGNDRSRYDRVATSGYKNISLTRNLQTVRTKYLNFVSNIKTMIQTGSEEHSILNAMKLKNTIRVISGKVCRNHYQHYTPQISKISRLISFIFWTGIKGTSGSTATTVPPYLSPKNSNSSSGCISLNFSSPNSLSSQ